MTGTPTLSHDELMELAGGLSKPMRYALSRSPVDRVFAGAGCTADLVHARLAEWQGANTWLARWTPLGIQVRDLLRTQGEAK